MSTNKLTAVEAETVRSMSSAFIDFWLDMNKRLHALNFREALFGDAHRAFDYYGKDKDGAVTAANYVAQMRGDV